VAEVQAERKIYARAELMAMTRDELLAYFKSEGPPERLSFDHLKNAATETLRQIARMQLEDEGRLTE
jgi:hypothetical protein